MALPQTSVERFLAREGWHYLGWTVNRQMVRLHDRIGWACIGAAPILAPLAALMIEPKGAAIGVSLAIAGAVHLGVFHWVKKNPEMRDEPAPRLTPAAKKFLKRVVTAVVGKDPLGQKYYGRFLKQSATEVRQSAMGAMSPAALESFETTAEAYNRLSGLCQSDPLLHLSHLKTASDAMAAALDLTARLDAYPEQEADLKPRVMGIVDQLTELANQIELSDSVSESRLKERLDALRQLQDEGHEPHVEQQTHQA
mgnify:CR=1 FL=1